jgi:hypothetical protein
VALPDGDDEAVAVMELDPIRIGIVKCTGK